MPKLAGRRLTLRHLYLVLSIALFFMPWLAFRDDTYSGLTFREFAAAHSATATGSTLPPITWGFVVFAPVAAVAGLVLEWRGGRRTTADFLAGCAVFIGPIALGFAAFEAQVRLLPGAYAAFLLAAAMLATDLFRSQRSEDGRR
jgi:hypothetical protein